ncbi:MAG: chromosome segregation protein SMC [Acidobacteriia bacterium]|nr:chromosome segregation protein SMC [Terriglobia bacterium]
MYKLKRVELLGFKSFADRTRLELADGIAAVVGPNGCGKSNLSDAISWVLGEQSARSLRGERMADVIFNGTSARPQTGMAEVSLTLVNPEYTQADSGESELNPSLFPGTEGSTADAEPGSKGDHPAADRAPAIPHRAGETVVTRRLFRSGESEYLINGEACRLRDIQDLFMGTGLGPESYAIIEQGRIGQILSSKPSDRRAIIEEAAGVSKFKTRKRLAEAKLESSRLNLARITDILEEVTKQVNSLKRQASKARRFREMQEELRGRLKIVLTSRLMALEGECQQLRGELGALQSSCAEAAQHLDEIDREQKAAATRYDDLETLLSQLRKSISQGDLERERLQARIEQVRQQATSLEARGVDATREAEALQVRLASLDQEAVDRARQAESLQSELTTAQDAARQLLARQEELVAQTAQAEGQIEASRQALLVAVSESAELRNQLVQAEEMGLALDRQAARSRADCEAVEQARLHLQRELEAFASEQQRGHSTLAELVNSVNRTAAALEQARQEEITRRTEVETLRQDFSGAVARKQALEESLARHAYSTESVRRLLSANRSGSGNGFHPLGVLADFVEVAPGYEEVVEDFLKAELDCVVVERHDEARTGISLLKSEGTGRSTFFVTHFPANGHTNENSDAEIRATAGVVAPVGELVRFEPRLGLNGGLALPELANSYVVADAATAESLAASYPECHFLTTSGEHYHHRLVEGGKGKSAGPLALRRDFRALERRLAEVESKLRAAEAALSDVTVRTARLEEELRGLTAAKLEAEKKAVVAAEKLRQTRESFDRTSERLRVLRQEAAALESEHRAVAERQTSLRAQLETAASERARREERVAVASGLVRELRAQLDTLSQDIVDAQARSSALEERNRALEAERARLATQAEEVRGRIRRLEEQCQGWLEQQRQLAQESQASRLRFQLLESEQRASRERHHLLEEESHTVRARRDELNPQIEAARAELDAHREKRSEIEVALARAESNQAHHSAQCRQELHSEPAALLAELPAEQALSGDPLLAAEEQVCELKTRIENLGPVNMMALEELQEAEERYDFLETQRQDLLASIEDTAQAIKEIDQVSRQQFLEAFQAINIYFAESFRTLFGGGIGEMRLSDESDAESGIDIAAQPPGKRLQNVLLLSGGEKALAALALLIALFRYTPSPFCILDEVDAPLDESNVDRFTRLIQVMSRHTQFILITHNKRTMEISEVMYGVTMEEPGVSKLVSVRFDDVAREPEEVPVLA